MVDNLDVLWLPRGFPTSPRRSATGRSRRTGKPSLRQRWRISWDPQRRIQRPGRRIQRRRWPFAWDPQLHGGRPRPTASPRLGHPLPSLAISQSRYRSRCQSRRSPPCLFRRKGGETKRPEVSPNPGAARWSERQMPKEREADRILNCWAGLKQKSWVRGRKIENGPASYFLARSKIKWSLGLSTNLIRRYSICSFMASVNYLPVGLLTLWPPSVPRLSLSLSLFCWN